MLKHIFNYLKTNLRDFGKIFWTILDHFYNKFEIFLEKFYDNFERCSIDFRKDYFFLKNLNLMKNFLDNFRTILRQFQDNSGTF